MGFLTDMGTRIRDIMRRDKAKAAIAVARGASGGRYPETGYDLLQSYGYGAMAEYLRVEQDLLARFVDYEEMDEYPELCAALNIYADDATQPDVEQAKTVWATSQNKDTETTINDLFHRRLRLDEEVWEIARTLVKYGNDYSEILVTADGVQGLNYLPPHTVRRIEGWRGELYGFVQDFKGRITYSPDQFKQLLANRVAGADPVVGLYGGNSPVASGIAGADFAVAFEGWEVVHMRLRGKHRRSVYGVSILDGTRWIWKRLLLLEDAALIYRLQRAPERYAFYVDVGDLPPPEALALLNRTRQTFKKKKFVDPSTGKLNLKINQLAPDEDFFIPVRKGAESTRIDVVGSPSWQHMEDVEYFQDKMFAAMSVPKAYLAKEEGVARSVLSNIDVRFARAVLRVQRELRNGFAKVARVHLAALGQNPFDAEFDVRMTVPSTILELGQLEARNARADLAARMQEHVSLHWLLSKIYKLSDDDIEVVMKQRHEDALRLARSQAEAEALIAKAQQGAMGGGGGFGSSVRSGHGPLLAESPAGLRNKRLRLLPRGGTGISERELFAGDREGEKRAEEKLNKLLQADRQTRRRLDEVRGLLRDISSSVRTRAAA